MMELNYELTPEDYFKFYKEQAPTQSSHKPMVTLFLIIYMIFLFADIIYGLITGEIFDLSFRQVSAALGIRSIILFISIFAVVGGLNSYSRYEANKILKVPKNGSFCEHRLILNEKELIELTDFNTAHYSWKTIGEIKEFESFLSIEITFSSLYIIPKRYFRDRAHIDEFLQTASHFKQNSEHIFQPSHIIEYEKMLEK